MSNIPYVEYYRPKQTLDIVLDPINRKILNTIVKTQQFPNMLFYGPPGTGKTTTITNVIHEYQLQTNNVNNELIIHLNASDDRGIDIIRNQIQSFVQSKPLFGTGLKFVILDEVDYMTTIAQQALVHLIQQQYNNVRFCLICNYVSKVISGLQEEFVKLRFNQLPSGDIVSLLTRISNFENIQVSHNTLEKIQQLFQSDIRSMINFMHVNQHILCNNMLFIDNETWETLLNMIESSSSSSSSEEATEAKTLDDIIVLVSQLSTTFNVDKKHIMLLFINYIVRNKPKYIHNSFLSMVENIMHSRMSDYYVEYIVSHMMEMNFLATPGKWVPV